MGGEGVHGGRTCHLVVTVFAPIKSSARRGGAQTFSAQVSLADRDARYGAHFPGAALLSGVVPVRPQGRLQVY